MRNVANPFKPTDGGEPPLLIGRRKVIRDFEKGLDNGVGAPGRIMLITGARGTGKTVILTVLGDKARARKWDVIEETASEGLCERLVNELRDRDGLLDRLTIKPSLSFAGASVSLGEAELSPKRMPETLRKAMAERITLLEKHHAGLLISIDETQAADRSDMIAIATAIQHQIRERRNIAIAFAGLPQMVSDLFNDEVITFLRRAKMNVLTSIPVDEVRDAFRTTFHDSGMHIDEQQLQTAAAATCGYPYMIQLVGYHIWDAADMRNSDEISDDDVSQGITEARIDLDNAVCIPELHGLSRNDRAYLKAMAQSDGPSSTTAVAKRMGKTPNYAATYRKRLLDAYVIRETERGEVDFAVPFLREYLRRHGDE
ncbi:ATP-binding protein [Bifidobacterium callitrichos]|uniref:ATPase AAA n=1 Tax=Bifidobacterium callitrichos DSM 23973 TaxID=1437609 RepID=A0A087AAY7_9BIFI|nr:ATP-binding protein [Bifidobacterium callitrichos]KFI55937.1 ATPase AAA [Bifidobacterium callitrichos DSM 23973]